jgi:hypothetical protein
VWHVVGGVRPVPRGSRPAAGRRPATRRRGLNHGAWSRRSCRAAGRPEEAARRRPKIRRWGPCAAPFRAFRQPAHDVIPDRASPRPRRSSCPGFPGCPISPPHTSRRAAAVGPISIGPAQADGARPSQLTVAADLLPFRPATFSQNCWLFPRASAILMVRRQLNRNVRPVDTMRTRPTADRRCTVRNR